MAHGAPSQYRDTKVPRVTHFVGCTQALPAFSKDPVLLSWRRWDTDQGPPSGSVCHVLFCPQIQPTTEEADRYTSVSQLLPCMLAPAFIDARNEDRSVSLTSALLTAGSLKKPPMIPLMICWVTLRGLLKIWF